MKNKKIKNKKSLIKIDNSKFKCEHCTKMYSRKSDLTRHKNKHLDVFKYQCEKCNRTFTRLDVLRKHEKNKNACVYYIKNITKKNKWWIYLNKIKNFLVLFYI